MNTVRPEMNIPNHQLPFQFKHTNTFMNGIQIPPITNLKVGNNFIEKVSSEPKYSFASETFRPFKGLQYKLMELAQFRLSGNRYTIPKRDSSTIGYKNLYLNSHICI